ncbi:MAG: cell division protein FtsB [Gammaproteobacteria bacterium]|nr:MAG: cell division protein FtsB [Gammaproteobacteria bacterium]
MRRALLALLVLLILGLQVRLWVGEGSLAEVAALQRAITRLQAENRRLARRNAALAAEVRDLRHGLEALEERARDELGMIRDGERFYQVVQPQP